MHKTKLYFCSIAAEKKKSRWAGKRTTRLLIKLNETAAARLVRKRERERKSYSERKNGRKKEWKKESKALKRTTRQYLTPSGYSRARIRWRVSNLVDYIIAIWFLRLSRSARLRDKTTDLSFDLIPHECSICLESSRLLYCLVYRPIYYWKELGLTMFFFF